MTEIKRRVSHLVLDFLTLKFVKIDFALFGKILIALNIFYIVFIFCTIELFHSHNCCRIYFNSKKSLQINLNKIKLFNIKFFVYHRIFCSLNFFSYCLNYLSLNWFLLQLSPNNYYNYN